MKVKEDMEKRKKSYGDLDKLSYRIGDTPRER